ncbi:MAG: F420-dependent oxidoreductase [Gammaproteobacteria bacterium]|nr:F420-dependent oxidoreductase [Gammaproteobacteria bacterium]|tara:strand:- start:788 stop:1753 length:966 start_codon:yes stop_codon:yes gene_type:complete
MANPFRFGLQSFNAESGKQWAERARKAEDLGYSAIHLADHLLGPGPAIETANHPVQNLAAIPAMAYAAAVTNTIKIGSRVFCIDYHVPVVLIKSALTIDLLSDGRLELGLGAGWIKSEYAAVGIDFDEPRVRIDRLADVIAGMRAYRAEGPTEITNDTLNWSGFEGVPKPTGSVPLIIGGGSPRVLRLAGREADIVSLNFNNRSGMIGPDGLQKSTAAETRKKLEWIREGAGKRFNKLELEIGVMHSPTDGDVAPVVAQVAQGFGFSQEEARNHPHLLFGSVDAVCEQIEQRREEYGISYFTVQDASIDSFAPVVARLAGK